MGFAKGFSLQTGRGEEYSAGFFSINGGKAFGCWERLLLMEKSVLN